MLTENLLSWLIFFPLVAALVVAVVPARSVRGVALALAALQFLFSILLPLAWRYQAAFQFELNREWLPEWGIRYHLGVDGLSMLLIMLTTVLTPLVIIAAWSDITRRVREFLICLLLLEGAIIGVFCALDVILFYIFWEAVLIPMYLLIGVWGGPRRIYSAVKFFLFTMAGSVLVWIAMLYIYFSGGEAGRSFDYAPFMAAARQLDVNQPTVALWLFGAFALAFAIKVPLFPVHTWLPDAHTEAPTAGSVILAAVLLKMGTYGFLRFAIPFFPQAAKVAAPLLIGLAVVGIIYGALVAMMQTDVKKLVAYSSVSHLGFVVLGIFAALLAPRYGDVALSGATLQMVNHGLSTGALFLLVGVIYERRHTRELSNFGGLAAIMPRYTVLFWIALFASVGLPGLNGFVGEYLILQGSLEAGFWPVALAATGVILGAVYMLRMFRSLMFGELVHEENRHLADVNVRETLVLAAVLGWAVWIGVMPQPFLNIINPSTQALSVLAQSDAAPLVAEVPAP